MGQETQRNQPAVPSERRPPAATAPARPRPTSYLRFLIASLLFALTFGSTLGACMLASMTLPWNLLHGLPLAAVKTAHGYAQVYGFATLFIMGVAYHVVPRFKGVALIAPGCAAPSFWLQVSGVLLVALAMLAGDSVAALAWPVGSAALFAAALLFSWSISRTLAAGRATSERIEPFLQAGCLWLVAAAALGLIAASSGRAALQPAMWEMALWGFVGSWLLGVSLRILPGFMGVAQQLGSMNKKLFIAYQGAVAAWAGVAVVETWQLVPVARAVAGGALVFSVAALVLRLGVLGRRQRSEGDRGGYAKFIVAAYGWVLVALFFAPGWSAVAALSGGGTPALLVDFGRHAFTLGFLTQTIIGVATRVVPVFSGAPLWSRSTRDATFYLLNAAVLTRGFQVVVELAGSDTLWPYISLSGVFGVAAFAAFTLNVFMTIRSGSVAQVAGKSADAPGVPSADDIVANLLRIPGALELLVAHGLHRLSDPEMRAAMAGTVTLRQACRIHGIAVDPLITDLRRLAEAKRPA